MSDLLTLPQACKADAAPPRYVARPAEREADAQNMIHLIQAHRAWRDQHGAAVNEPPVPAVLGLVGEIDQLGHPMSWVLYAGDRLRACYLLAVDCDQRRVQAADIHVNPDASRTGVGQPAARLGLTPSTPVIEVLLTYWLVHYAFDGGAREAVVTIGDRSEPFPPARIAWMDQTVDTRIPDDAHLARCWDRQPRPRASPEFPPPG
ncbi:hypothetical protein [Streptomyces rimosus]|uniref:hypothetical protein n=1 Tax=Streptomyces rimosus TaxID=1927 RepID=UPI0004C6A1BA|nr:hypothetical protein [Streptomyces rimosus]